MPKQSKAVMLAHHEEIYSGPLPSPDIFEKYDAVLPGTAERILSMAEQQAAHRQEIESKQVDAEIEYMRAETRDSLLGIISALILGILCMGLAAASIILSPSSGGAIFGGVIGVAGIGTVITAFLSNTRMHGKKE